MSEKWCLEQLPGDTPRTYWFLREFTFPEDAEKCFQAYCRRGVRAILFQVFGKYVVAAYATEKTHLDVLNETPSSDDSYLGKIRVMECCRFGTIIKDCLR